MSCSVDHSIAWPPFNKMHAPISTKWLLKAIPGYQGSPSLKKKKLKKAEKNYELNNLHLHHLKCHCLTPFDTKNYKLFYKQDLKNKALVVINSFQQKEIKCFNIRRAKTIDQNKYQSKKSIYLFISKFHTAKIHNRKKKQSTNL